MDDIKVADRVWLATALLHQEHPERESFGLSEIMDRAVKEFGKDKSAGVRHHISAHTLASNPPQPARYRMLTQTAKGQRRLYRQGDIVHPGRTGKITPDPAHLPAKYHRLLTWYAAEFNRLKRSPEQRSTPESFLKYAGLIAAYDLSQMQQVIEADCERVDLENVKDGEHVA